MTRHDDKIGEDIGSDIHRGQRRTGSPASRPFRLDKGRAVFGGVCAGLARHMDWDEALVRTALVLSTIFLAGSLALAYLVIWAIAD